MVDILSVPSEVTLKAIDTDIDDKRSRRDICIIDGRDFTSSDDDDICLAGVGAEVASVRVQYRDTHMLGKREECERLADDLRSTDHDEVLAREITPIGTDEMHDGLWSAWYDSITTILKELPHVDTGKPIDILLWRYAINELLCVGAEWLGEWELEEDSIDPRVITQVSESLREIFVRSRFIERVDLTDATETLDFLFFVADICLTRLILTDEDHMELRRTIKS